MHQRTGADGTQRLSASGRLTGLVAVSAFGSGSKGNLRPIAVIRAPPLVVRWATQPRRRLLGLFTSGPVRPGAPPRLECSRRVRATPLAFLQTRIAVLDVEIAKRAKTNALAKRLMIIAGVGRRRVPMLVPLTRWHTPTAPKRVTGQ